MPKRNLKNIISAVIIFIMLFIIILCFSNLNKETVISSYYTNLSGRSKSEMNNIKIVLKILNGFTLQPNEIFSFNNIVGERNFITGFEKAPVITNNLVENKIGGGICQVSSTLYNCVLLGGLKITQRHSHLLTVNSVPPGRDATVSYGVYDLCFKNIYQFPIKIKTNIIGDRLIIKILGKEKLFDYIKIEERKTGNYYSKNKKGIKIEIYRLIKWRNEKQEKEFISNDVYYPVI